jgi:vancomycin resistance protein YoaR
LIPSFGGGVCQTSTTLYNAALRAGLPIVERHPHVFAAHYAPPGRDAAVAQFTVDLRFQNPYPWPIRLRAVSKGERLIVQVLGREKPKASVQVTTEVLSVTTPQRLTRVLYRPEGATGRTFLRNPGATGYRVVTHRVFTENGREVRRERLGDDTYQAMNKIVQRTEEGGNN